MFVQIIQGKTSDAAALRERFDVWLRDLADGATGWLGATGGVTDDGRFIEVVRFESEEAARGNSERPEQGEWWKGTEPLLSDVTFHDCGDVETIGGGGSDDAGFVQMIQARTSDVDRLKALGREMETLSEHRPEVLGGLVAFHGDGGFTQAVYFTSEAEAREGEAQEPPADIRGKLEEFFGLIEDPTYYDLKSPWLISP